MRVAILGGTGPFGRGLATRLELPGLRDDVDTWDDLERVRDRVGPNTRTYLEDRA